MRFSLTSKFIVSFLAGVATANYCAYNELTSQYLHANLNPGTGGAAIEEMGTPCEGFFEDAIACSCNGLSVVCSLHPFTSPIPST